MALFSFRRRAADAQPKSKRPTGTRALGRRTFEQLESRTMLSINFDTLNNIQEPGGKDVLVPLTATDSRRLAGQLFV